MLAVKPRSGTQEFQPLEKVTIQCGTRGVLSVRDGEDREYARCPARGKVVVQAAGALGTHRVRLEDRQGRVTASATFRVNTATAIEDAGGRYAGLLRDLYWTMGRHVDMVRYNDRFYRFFVCWLRDHVHTLKGMKYFYPDLKGGIDLYADSQREDGMIWDNVHPRAPEWNTWDGQFTYGDFIRPFENATWEFKRIPVENDVEYLFIEGLYYTWKATGDTAWMAALLDKAIKAVTYSTTDAYRWSRKYGLLKRGFTIDTWDFQSEEDTAISGHGMVVFKDRSRFGIMHGDNTGFIAGLRYLAEMLQAAGRAKEAPRFLELADTMAERLNALAWNGRFYTHHVPEQVELKRDLGVDPARQVSLSNAYALNRGIGHDRARKIIRTYQDIRRRMPKSSPGEWYQIYPPFQKGFGGHNGLWEYMNGGVTTIVAGELAHGAFEHGCEAYGVDILERVARIGRRHGGYFHCTYRGAMPEAPKRKFTPLNLRAVANADFRGTGAEGVPGWTAEGDNDLRFIPCGKRTFHGIPCVVIDPAKNGRRACLALSTEAGYAQEARLSVGCKAASLYFHHTMSRGNLAGTVTIRYRDGSAFTDYIDANKIGNWWVPEDRPKDRKRAFVCRVAWRGRNKVCGNVGTYVYGLDNPRPDQVIDAVEFEAARNAAKWMVLGVTLCDKPVFFMPSDVSFGIPDNWGAAAVVYALIEGLAGIKDTDVACRRVRLSPRWPAAGVDAVTVTAKYEASGGYLRYRYARDARRRTLAIEFTGNAAIVDVDVLLPCGARPRAVFVDGLKQSYRRSKVERSCYVCFKVKGIGIHRVQVALR